MEVRAKTVLVSQEAVTFGLILRLKEENSICHATQGTSVQVLKDLFQVLTNPNPTRLRV